MADEEKKQDRPARRRMQYKKYRDSDHGKRVRTEYAERYRRTEHGKRIIRKCVDKYQETRICFTAANRSRFWLPVDSIEANFVRLIKREFRTPELIRRIRKPDKDMLQLMRLVKKLLPTAVY